MHRFHGNDRRHGQCVLAGQGQSPASDGKKSKIKVEGNVAALLKLAPLGKKLYPRYIATLQADSRADLIA